MRPRLPVATEWNPVRHLRVRSDSWSARTPRRGRRSVPHREGRGPAPAGRWPRHRGHARDASDAGYVPASPTRGSRGVTRGVDGPRRSVDCSPVTAPARSDVIPWTPTRGPRPVGTGGPLTCEIPRNPAQGHRGARETGRAGVVALTPLGGYTWSVGPARAATTGLAGRHPSPPGDGSSRRCRSSRGARRAVHVPPMALRSSPSPAGRPRSPGPFTERCAARRATSAASQRGIPRRGRD